MSEPLWTDENITNDARRATSSPTEQAKIRSCLLFMRHGYEAERAKDKQRIQELEQERDGLRQELDECAQVAGALARQGDDIVKWRKHAGLPTRTTPDDALAELATLEQPQADWQPLQTKIALGFGHESIVCDATSIGGLPLPDDVRIMQRVEQPQPHASNMAPQSRRTAS